MTLSRLEDFDPNYRNRLGGDIRSFEVYTNSNEYVGRVIDAWVDDIGNIQQLVVDLNAPSPGNRVMLPLSQAQFDRATRRIYVNDLPHLQTSSIAGNRDPIPPQPSPSRPDSYAPPQSRPAPRVASLEDSAPLEGYSSPEPVRPTSQPSRRVELPPIPPAAYSDQPPQPIDYTAHPHVPPVDVQRETYPQGYAAHPPVPPIDVHSASPPPIPREYEWQDPSMQYAEHREDAIPHSEAIGDREYPKVVEEETIPVLEERLIVDNHVRKAGEVVVRKEIETEIIEVPVKREKLIVEQVGPEPKQLAEIDLQQDDLPGTNPDRRNESRRTRKRLD